MNTKCCTNEIVLNANKFVSFATNIVSCCREWMFINVLINKKL